METPLQETTPTSGRTEALPTTREGREKLIGSWLRQPANQAAAPAESAEATSGDESPPDGNQGNVTDLSQSPPDQGAEHQSEGAEGEGKPDADEPATDSDRRGLINKIRALKADRREAKATAETLQSELVKLRAENEALKARKPEGKPEPAEEAPDIGADAADVQRNFEQAQQVHDWAEGMLDRALDDPDSVGRELEAYGIKSPDEGWTSSNVRERLRVFRNNALATMRQAPKRLNWLANESAALNTVAQLAPEAADPENPLHAELQGVVAAHPWIRQRPNWPVLALAGALGMRELAKRGKPTPKPAAPARETLPNPPRLPGAPRSGVANPAASTKAIDELRTKATARGATQEDRVAYIRESLRTGSTRK
ncbi:MAG: hypothetical protein E6Q97_37630 [Desulfurellales bacterium]|nr:MAG: hypothetical protein E6Q97_37630 [Desulfurellales bacterium]